MCLSVKKVLPFDIIFSYWMFDNLILNFTLMFISLHKYWKNLYNCDYFIV